MRVVHPAVDEWGDGYGVYATSAPTVRLTDAFTTFLTSVAEAGFRPVLMSRVDARVSAHVSLAMRRACGYWMVQARDGSTFDALTGYQVASPAELWAGAGEGRAQLAAFDQTPVGPVRSLSFDIHCTRQASGDARAGVLAQVVMSGLGGAGLDSWGVAEPLLDPWDLSAVTGFAQGLMPDAGPILADGPDGGFAQVRVSRTKRGLLENAVGAVPIPAARGLAELVGRASGVLERVAQEFVPTIGFVSAVDFDEGLTQCARARLPEVPLAMIAGPKTVRDLALDVEALSGTHDVSVFGRAKTPGVIVRFSRPDVGQWTQLVDMVRGVDLDRFSAVAGLPPGALETWGAGLPTGTPAGGPSAD